MDIKNILNTNFRINSIINSLSLITNETLYLTGGTLRNAIWNKLHNFNDNYELEDCDVIFYNSNNILKSYENHIENELKIINPNIEWSVKNQARMHVRNGHLPYGSLFNALFAFPETCSAVALGKNWEVIAPYGISDLLNLSLVETNYCRTFEKGTFIKRIIKKEWLNKWPELKLGEEVRFTTTCIKHSLAVA